MKDLIKKYEAKIEAKKEAIKILAKSIEQAKNGDTASDMEELQEEMNNAIHDKKYLPKLCKGFNRSLA